MPQKDPIRRALFIAVVLLCVSLMAVAIEAQGPNVEVSSSTGADINPMDMNWINVTPDVLSTTGVFNVTWNLTPLWNPGQFPDCYIRIYSQYHTQLLQQLQLVGPTALNRTGTLQIPFSSYSNGVYFLNLQCEVKGGITNTTVPYQSVNEDIVPVVVNVAPNAVTRANGMAQADNYYSCAWRNGLSCDMYNWSMPKCQNAPINCPMWQSEAASGRTWNNTLGVPV